MTSFAMMTSTGVTERTSVNVQSRRTGVILVAAKFPNLVGTQSFDVRLGEVLDPDFFSLRLDG
jgi:hypothetical protein